MSITRFKNVPCIILLFLFFSFMRSAVYAQNSIKPVQLSVGGEHACALMSDGTIRCWGSGDIGQLGNGKMASSSVPVTVQGIHDAVSIVAGGLYTCALLSSGKVKCWGITEFGMLGKKMNNPEKCSFSKNNYFPCTTKPMVVDGVDSVAQLSGRNGLYCALLKDGEIKCWGGINKIENPELDGVVMLTSGQTHTCALLGDGTVHCWGSGEYAGLGQEVCGEGMLSYGAECTYKGKTVYLSYSDAKKVCAQVDDEKCNVDTNEGAPNLCCPEKTEVNADGSETTSYACAEMHDSTYGCKDIMQYAVDTSKYPAKNLSDVKLVCASTFATYAVKSDGSVWFWGQNHGGVVPHQEKYDQMIFTPMQIPELSGVVDISADLGGCAALADGRVQCWGSAMLGNGKNASTKPADVHGIHSAVSVGTGDGFACALLSDGIIKCWGNNALSAKQFGQLGDGTNKKFSAVPVTVVVLK